MDIEETDAPESESQAAVDDAPEFESQAAVDDATVFESPAALDEAPEFESQVVINNGMVWTDPGFRHKGGLLHRIDWTIVGIVLAIKALVFIYGATAYQLLYNQRIKDWYGLLEIWNSWDAQRHVRLAEAGYTNEGLYRTDLVGFPLYPWLIRLLNYIFHDTQVSAFILTGFCAIAAALLLYKLSRIDQPESIARNSVWFLLIFPTSYFLHINYTESLFIALAVGCLLAARKQNWLLAGILGIFLCMTRLNGVVIIPVLMIEAFQQFWEDRRWSFKWAYIAVIPLGFVVHLLVNYQVAGDFFAFITVGRELFYKSFEPPWNGITGLYHGIWFEPPPHGLMAYTMELVFVILGFVCILFSAVLLRPAYTVWLIGNWLLFTSVGLIQSGPRYTLTLFPIFILFAKLAERPVWYSVITVSSLFFMAMFIGQFVRGHWAF